MQNFDWTKFTRKIVIQSSIQEIYDAWTIPRELEKWFLSKALFYDQGGNPSANEENISSDYTYSWNWHAQEMTEHGRVINANGSDYFSFSFAGHCLVEVKISGHASEIIVELTQSNIPTDEKSKQNIRLGCDSGWSFFLVNLKSVYEGGIDLRNKDSRFTGMVNN